MVFTHVLRGRIRQLGNRLTIALNHLDDDLQRLVTQIVGQVGTNSKRELATSSELLVQSNDALDRQTITKNQRLGHRVYTVLTIVFDHAFTPSEWIATVMASTVKQLAEIHIEVTQERLNAVDVAQGNAQIASVFTRPSLKAKHLAIAQARAQRLASLQIFMCHGAKRTQVEFHCEQGIAGTG